MSSRRFLNPHVARRSVIAGAAGTAFMLFRAINSQTPSPAAPATPVHSDVIVETDLGSVRGNQFEGYATFQGIPYAAPPVGEFRWAVPET